MNNSQDEKISEALKKTYDGVTPSSELRDRIQHSYKQTQQDNIEVDNLKSNLLKMFQFKKIILVGSAIVVVLLLGGVAMYIGGDKKNMVFKEDLNQVIGDNSIYSDAENIVNDIDEEMDDLLLIAQQGDEDDKNAESDLDDFELDELVESLNGLDELDEILDDDVLNDELFL